MFEQIDAILFDFDGTLVEPSIDFHLMHRAVLEVVAAYGIDPDGLREMHTLEMVRHVEQLIEEDRSSVDAASRSRRFAEQAHRAVIDIEIEAARRVDAYPGVPRMLRALAECDLKVGIVTRNCRPAVEQILRRIPLRHNVLITRDDVAHVKPDPRHLLAALEVLDVPGERTLMCGDHPMDIVAGRRIGARTVGVLRPGVEREYFAGVAPDLILDRVVELVDHIACGDTFS